MPLNDQLLRQGIYAAFRRQSVKPGPSKVGVEMQLATDISRAISIYIRQGLVMTAVTSIGVGATAPHPMIVPVFTVTTGTGTGIVT
jgi:hypothetical protein